jgi:transcriptional regulator with GAF, ATPase, and Fis domain
MSSNNERVNLESIALQMTSSLDLKEVLTTVTQGLVDELGASFARIWLLGNGDLCDQCQKASICNNRDKCLHLKASAGIYTTLSGEYRRIPLGGPPAGQVASNRKPICTNDIVGDKRFPNKKWIQKNSLCSYGAYPLIFRKELLGTIAMFSQRKITQDEFKHLAGFANQAAIVIKNAQLFSEVERLKDRLHAECVYLREEIKLYHNFEDIIGNSKSIKKILADVEKVAPTDATVLIEGETGTGKELIARAIHGLSPRKERPLIKVNCAGLASSLIESELFGHEKGAFTSAVQQKIGRFELASGGTIFLDEIGDLPFDTQAKLLRVLQDKEFERVGGTHTIEVDVRVIAATNRNLKIELKAGKFREDLYYRLNIFPISVPPLRERNDDIPLLVNHFTNKYGHKFSKPMGTISQKMMGKLQAYSWPGNIRELENIIERAIILSPGNTLQLEDVFNPPPKEKTQAAASDNLLDVERGHIIRILDDTKWTIEGKHGAAIKLGLKPATLRSRMKKLGIKRS